MNPGRPSRIFYGWIIVGVSLVSLAFWFGLRASFSVFYVVLVKEFSWGRGETAGVQSAALLTYTLAAPILGGLLDRFGPRIIVSAGSAVLAGSLLLCATQVSLGQFYLFYGLGVGLGLTAIGLVTYTAVLTHWFIRRRGLASGLAVSGMGLGTFVILPLSQFLIEASGWRTAFLVFAGLALCLVLPLNAALLRHKPSDLGLQPDGEDGYAPEIRDILTANPTRPDWTLAAAARTGRFWALLAFPFLAVLAVYTILVHQVNFLVDQGVPARWAAFSLAGAGIVSMVFRIFWGWLSDRVGREVSFSLGMLAFGLALLSLILLEGRPRPALVLSFVAFFGVGWGSTAPMFMATAADLFAGRQIGLIYGLIEAVLALGGALGAFLPGLIHDRTGSYQGAFVLALIAVVLSCGFIWLAGPRHHAPARRRRVGENF